MGIKTAIAEAVSGKAGPEEQRSLTEELARASLSAEILQENLTRLELAQEDSGWRRQSLETEREFTRAGLDDIAMLSRSMYLSHPLINRAVNVTTFYVFGQGVQVTTDKENDKVQKTVIDKTLQDDGNIAELFGHTAQLLGEVDQMVEGNIFLVLYTDQRGDVEIRSFPLAQIRKIYTKEGDKRLPAYYLRRWSEKVFDEDKGQEKIIQKEELYPDWRYHPRNKRAKIGRIKCNWDAPIMHQKTGGMKDMQFGIPETYAALDWARAYRKFLENWASIIASLSKFAWQFETKGREIQNAKKKFQSTIAENEGIEDNDQPAGQVALTKKGDKLVPIPKSGASTSAEDGRQMRLMVASAMNLPDTMLANDPQQGALATAQTLDRPTELYIRSRQQMWSDMYHNIFRYIIDRKIEQGLLQGQEVWNERKGTMEFIPKDGLDDIEISFPPILEHDMESTVRAIVTAATLEGRPDAGSIPKDTTTELLLEVLGVKDINEAIEVLAKQTESELEEKVKELGEQLALSGNPNDPNNPGKPEPSEGDE